MELLRRGFYARDLESFIDNSILLNFCPWEVTFSYRVLFSIGLSLYDVAAVYTVALCYGDASNDGKSAITNL
jgi:hypothetical protein